MIMYGTTTDMSLLVEYVKYCNVIQLIQLIKRTKMLHVIIMCSAISHDAFTAGTVLYTTIIMYSTVPLDLKFLSNN